MSNNKEQKERIDYWRNEYWPELQKADFDSEEKQEKYVFTISTGAVGLLLGTLSFQIKPKGISLAIIALGLFTLSMLSCIIYHIVAKKKHKVQFKLIEDFISNSESGDAKIRKHIERSNCFLDWWSIISVVLIFAGIVLFTVYLIKNLI